MDLTAIEVPFPEDPDNAISFVVEVQTLNSGEIWWNTYTKFRGRRTKIGGGPAKDDYNGEQQGRNHIYVWLDSQNSAQTRMNQNALKARALA
jgi:hypothetical protein